MLISPKTAWSEVGGAVALPSVAVVIPCFKVGGHIGGVLAAIGPEVDAIYCVDDACPETSGDLIEKIAKDPRVRVLRHEQNQGVGGAMLTATRRHWRTATTSWSRSTVTGRWTRG